VSDDRRAFWSSVPGLVTGLAGLLTAIVGLVGIAIQLGWIGGGSGSSSKTPASTTVVGQTTSPGNGPAATPGGTPSFTVEERSVDLSSVGARDGNVTIRNTGKAPLRVSLPTLTGPDAGQFKVTDLSCTVGTVDENRTCQVKVTFTPGTALRTYTARLVVQPTGAATAQEVPLTGRVL